MRVRRSRATSAGISPRRTASCRADSVWERSSVGARSLCAALTLTPALARWMIAPASRTNLVMGYLRWGEGTPTVYRRADCASPGNKPRPRRIAVSSHARTVVEVNHAIAEATFVQQLELQADLVGEGRFAASDHNGRDEEVALIDQPGLHRLGGEVGTADADVASGCRLHPAEPLRDRSLARSVSWRWMPRSASWSTRSYRRPAKSRDSPG